MLFGPLQELSDTLDGMLYGRLMHFGIKLRKWGCHWGQKQLCLYGVMRYHHVFTDRADQSAVPWLVGQCKTVIVGCAEVNACCESGT